MANLDPHLAILLQDFVRVCSEGTTPSHDHGAALNEIALFVHDERLHCAGSDIREYLLQHGYSGNRVTFLCEQYDRMLQALHRHDRWSETPAAPLSDTDDHQKGIMR